MSSKEIGPDEAQQIEQMFSVVGFDDDEYNMHHVNGVVSIQFHDLYEDRFGEFLEVLADECYSFDVDSGFEMPPQVKVVSCSEIVA